LGRMLAGGWLAEENLEKRYLHKIGKHYRHPRSGRQKLFRETFACS
jgi:hypothetical protein